jgi:hypothetical protein
MASGIGKYGAPLNNTDGKTEVLRGNNLSQCHCVHQKCHMDSPRIEPRPAR